MFKKLLGLGVLITVSLASATAATVSYSDTVSTVFVPNPDSLSFTIPLFDPLLGPLTGVTIKFEAELDGDFIAENLSSSDGSVTGTLSGEFVLDGPGLPSPLLTINPAGGFGPTVIPANDSIVFQVLNLMAMDSYFTSDPGELAALTGAGNFIFSGTAFGETSSGGSVNPLSFISSLSGDATVTVTYEYEGVSGVPEPMTLYLMGGGLLALSFFRPRRSKSTT